MSVYKMFANGTGGTENSVASFDVQFDGDIVAILGHLNPVFDANAESCNMEVSFLSSSTFSVNDARGSLFILGSRLDVITSGGSQGIANNAVSGVRIPVSAGERIHMHLNASAGVVSVAQAYLYITDAADENLRRRR